MPNTLLGSVTVTHPFHPLRGQTFSVLKVRKVHQVRFYSLDTDHGVLSVPEAWTDRQPRSGLPNTPWSPEVIQAVRQLVTMMEQSLDKD